MNFQRVLHKYHADWHTGKTEMLRLRWYLTNNNIKWEDASDYDKENSDVYHDEGNTILRTHFKIRENQWSVIFGECSYGSEAGCLELWTKEVNNGEPMGWLSAENIIDYIKRGDKNE